MPLPRYTFNFTRIKDALVKDAFLDMESTWGASMGKVDAMLKSMESQLRQLNTLSSLNRKTLFASATQASSVLAVETNLFNFTIKGGSLTGDLESIEGVCAGNFAATVGNKRVRVYFGATLIFDSGALAIAAASSWVIQFQIVRTGAATQKCSVTYNSSAAALPSSSGYFAATEVMNTDSVFRITGTGIANGDILGQFCKGEILASV